jgi:hypothetical protein
MGILTTAKSLFGTGSKGGLPVATASDSGWDQQQAREAQLQAEMREIESRIRHIQSTVLDPLSVQKQELAGIKAKRLQAGAAAFIDGKQQDLKSIDADIARREAIIVALEKDADIANHAMATLTERMQEKHREVALLKQEGLRVRVRQLEATLRDFAPEFQAKVEAYKDAVIEMTAIAMARDAIGPLVPGNTQVGSGGIAEVTVLVPQLPAYKSLGGIFNLHGAAQARMRQILAELGVRI